MRSSRRGGYLLCEVIMLLPAMAVILLVTTRLVNRSVAVHRLERQQEADRRQMTELVASIRSDAAQAQAAELLRGSDGVILRLAVGDKAVQYEVAGQAIERVETVAAERYPSEAWKFGSVETDFALEPVGGENRLVWVRFLVGTPIFVGEEVHRGGRDVSSRQTIHSADFLLGGEGE